MFSLNKNWIGFCIKGNTLDKYKGYHYYVPAREASHKEPYVAVDYEDMRVALVYIRTGEVGFYRNTPQKVKNEEGVMREWLSKNKVVAIREWNRLHPDFKV